MNVAYCGILNENWTVAPTIYFLNFIILGRSNNELKLHGKLLTTHKICYCVFQGEWLFVFFRFH